MTIHPPIKNDVINSILFNQENNTMDIQFIQPSAVIKQQQLHSINITPLLNRNTSL